MRTGMRNHSVEFYPDLVQQWGHVHGQLALNEMLHLAALLKFK